MTIVIQNVFVSDGVYTVVTTDGDTSNFTRQSSLDVCNLPNWSMILADLIDTYGIALEGKSLTIDTSSITVIVELSDANI
jgi:hypothetical protein